MDRAAQLRSIVDWLIDPGSRELALEELVDALVGWLERAGCTFTRVQLGLRMPNPEVVAHAYRWRRGDRTRPAFFGYDTATDQEYQASPIAALVESREPYLRCSLERPFDEIPYALCRQLKKEGGTEYVLLRVPGARGLMSMISYVTDRPGGFTDHEVELFHRVIPALSVRVEVAAAYHTSDVLLRTYLGQNASKRVLHGAVRRGQGERIRAVIWMCDLRGFTSFVDQTPLDEVIETLDAYFECVADTVIEHGGEVMKFIGDAVLAIFPVDEDPERVCRLALAAAREAFARGGRLSAEREESGKPPVRFGVALHLGDVMYGNIGATGRLDFTVIGGAVNEASRLESLCKELGAPLLLSETFVREGAVMDAVSLGSRTLRGVSHPVEVFTLPELAPKVAA